MDVVKQKDDDKALNDRQEELRKVASPIFEAMLRLATKDGVIDHAKLAEHLAMHAAIHVVEIKRLKEQVRTLLHNFNILRASAGPVGFKIP